VYTAAPVVYLKLVNAFHWNIQYVIYGYPPPNVTWFKDGSPLVQNDVIYDRVTSRGEAAVKGRLLFKMANHLDNGGYTLVATNVNGRTSRTISAVFLRSPGISLFVCIGLIVEMNIYRVAQKLANFCTPYNFVKY